jgi:hypothetical protein
MSALALAADGASAPGSVALWLSIAALAVSIGSVLATVSMWRRDGWRLDIVIRHHNLKLASASDPEPGPLASFEARVTNVGRLSCTVADVQVRTRKAGFAGRWDSRRWNARGRYTRYRGLIPDVVGPELPRQLAPSETMTVLFVPQGHMMTAGGPLIRVGATTGGRKFWSPWRLESEI